MNIYFCIPEFQGNRISRVLLSKASVPPYILPITVQGGVPIFHVFANLYCLLFLSVLYGTLLYVWFVFFNSWYMKHLFMSLLMVFGEVSVQILAYYFNHVICHFITTFFLDSKCKSVRYLTYKYLDHSVLSLRNVFVSTWCMGAHTTMHMWRSEDKSVHLVLSFHFSVGWGHRTQVCRLG